MVDFSFVVPIYNDAFLAERFCEEFRHVFQQYLSTTDIAPRVELIFVNDGSRDDSQQTLRAVCEKFPFAKVIALSRNFGQHIAVSCGYKFATGQYVGMLNVDMEDPPDQIPKFLDALKTNDHDIVYGLYNRRNVPAMQRVTSFLFNALLSRLTGAHFPTNTSTLRVLNRRFLDAYNSLNEKSRYIPGLELWLGFKQGFVAVRHQPRQVGRSSYDFRRRLRMAIDSIISFSDLPLRLAAALGFLVAILGLIGLGFLILRRLYFTDLLPGYTSTIAVIVFMAGVQILVVGLASLYIGRILREVQNRPLYVICDTYKL